MKQILIDTVGLIIPSGKVNPNFFRENQNEKLKNQIIEITSFLDSDSSMSERIWCILNGQLTKKLCSCGSNKPLGFINFKLGYYETCGRSCVLKTEKRNKALLGRVVLEEELNKRKQTFQERYGVSCLFQSEELITANKNIDYKQVSLKAKETVQERYGVDNVFQSQQVKDKITSALLDRYGVDNIMKTTHMKERFSLKNSQKQLPDGVYEKISSKVWWDRNYKKSLIDVSIQLDVSHSCAQVWAHKVGVDVFVPFESQYERYIQSFLKNLGVDFLLHSRKVISPLELDIYIPSHNIAIEVNGVYWHSELNGKGPKYHLEKTNKCLEQNIQLFHFWDTEIVHKKDIVFSMIKNALGLNERKIHGRQCQIREITSKQAFEFFEANHIQGGVFGTKNIGLFKDGDLVACMSFVKSRYRRDIEFELSRFASVLGTSIPGSFSRLLKAHSNPCVSYSDRRYSRGLVYDKNGFILERTNGPGYYYFKDGNILENRMKYQKHKLPKLLEAFDPSLTEWENMKMNGYDRVWDCGTMTWIYS